MFHRIVSLWSLAFHGLTIVLLAFRRSLSRHAKKHHSESVRMETLPVSDASIELSQSSPAPESPVPNKQVRGTLNRHDSKNMLAAKASLGPRAMLPLEGEICKGDLPETGLPTSKVYTQVLDVYPNDLTRLIYLASLRDCNSGNYQHPTLSRKYTFEMADSALRLCHEETFARVLALPVDDYVHQLNGYIRFSNVERSGLIKTWRALQAYRTVVPMKVTDLNARIFVSNINVALGIVEFAAAHALKEIE